MPHAASHPPLSVRLRARAAAVRLLSAAATILLLLARDEVAHADPLWPMWGGDARRTHRSRELGPAAANPERVRIYSAGCDLSINCAVTIDEFGDVFFGSWGRLVRGEDADPLTWTKGNGRIYGLTWDLSSELWTPFEPGPVPMCYDWPGRVAGSLYCPGHQFNGYNGTVEGAAAIGPDGLLYFGRGDGRLYAVDPNTGRTEWEFVTHNPLDPTDPEGGGEVVTPPLIHDGVVYFATWAPSNIPNAAWETNAIYGVDVGSRGAAFWRYPSAERTLPGEEFLAAPALSPDGARVYFASFKDVPDDLDSPRHLFAFDTSVPVEETGEEHLLWRRELTDPGVADSTLLVHRLSIGADGSLFVAGTRMQLRGGAWASPRAVVVRLDADGVPLWPRATELGSALDGTQVLGLALLESVETVQAVYAGQGSNNAFGGALIALEPDTGATDWSWRAGPAGMQGQVGDPTIDREGSLYFAVRGASGAGAGGWIVSLDARGTERWRLAVTGAIDWAGPVLGLNGSLYVGERAIEIFPITVSREDDCPAGTTPHLVAILGDPPAPSDGAGDAERDTDVGPDAAADPEADFGADVGPDAAADAGADAGADIETDVDEDPSGDGDSETDSRLDASDADVADEADVANIDVPGAARDAGEHADPLPNLWDSYTPDGSDPSGLGDTDAPDGQTGGGGTGCECATQARRAPSSDAPLLAFMCLLAFLRRGRAAV